MRKLFKLAQEIDKENSSKTKSADLMEEYVAKLRGLAMVHQTAHWLCRGDKFYGEHLLFLRLYENVTADLDLAAEKLIGVFGVEALDPESHIDMAKDFATKYKGSDFTERSLEAEVDFLTFSEDVYSEIKDSDNMTLGLDDMIMTIASNHEENVYLLKQQSK